MTPRHGQRRQSAGTHPLPDRRPGAPRPAARRGEARMDECPGRAAGGEHLHRRDHPGLGLLLLRRDARTVLARRPAWRRHQEGRAQGRRLRRGRERHLQGLRQLARAGALQRAEGGHQDRHREEPGEDLPAELPEHRPAHQHRLLARAAARARGEHPHRGVHPRARSDQLPHRRARRSLRLQPRPPRRKDRAAGDHHPPLGR